MKKRKRCEPLIDRELVSVLPIEDYTSPFTWWMPEITKKRYKNEN